MLLAPAGKRERAGPRRAFGAASVCPVDRARIYHNPRCAKSRGALALLESAGVTTEVVRYLETPPDADQLREMLRRLDEPPSALVRHDARFRALRIDPAQLDDEERVVDVLVAHPELMERPVVLAGGHAVIARPPDRVAEVIGEDA
jgi:arsenate reductase